MTSEDNAIRVELRELIAVNHEQIAEQKAISARMQKDNAEFRVLMMNMYNDFAEKQNAKFDAFTQKTDARFNRLEEQIAVMQNDITGLKHDVAGLYHWDYWLLSIILVVFAMPQSVAGIKSLFGAVAEGISLIIGAFRKGSRD